MLGVGVMSVTMFSTYSARRLQQSRQLGVATLVAEEQMNRLRAAPFDSLPAGVTVARAKVAGYDFYVVSAVNDSLPTLKYVTVAITRVDNKRLVQRFRTAVFEGRL